MTSNTINVQNGNNTPSTTAQILIENKIDYTPKVSVIIPVYNVEKYLRQCLDSVVNQTLKEIEIICVDDGSTDCSLDILKEYASKDPRFTIITQENSGPEKARNFALDIIKGQYVSFIDSDDWIDEKFLEIMVASIETNNVDIVECRFNEHIECNEKITKQTFKKSQLININSKNILQFKNILWNKLYKRDIIEKYHIRLPNVKYWGDNYWSLCYTSCCNKAIFIDNCLYNYRRNNNSLMLKYLRANTFEKKQIDMEFIETYRKTILFFNKNNLLKKYKNTLVFFLYKQIIWRLERLSNEDRKTFFSECMNILKPLEIFDTKYLCYSDNHKIYKINHFRSLNNYIKTITFLNFPILKIEHKYSNNSLIKPILKEKNKLLFNLIPIHKKQITTHKTKKYILGIKYYSKRKNYL